MEKALLREEDNIADGEIRSEKQPLEHFLLFNI